MQIYTVFYKKGLLDCYNFKILRKTCYKLYTEVPFLFLCENHRLALTHTNSINSAEKHIKVMSKNSISKVLLHGPLTIKNKIKWLKKPLIPLSNL